MKKNILKKFLLASIFSFLVSNPENIYACEDKMEEYLEKELEYYKENPEAIEKDLENYETIIDSRGDTYRKLVSHSIEDIENELGDLAYIGGNIVGNIASTGDREIVRKKYDGYIPVVVVKTNKGAEYPIAVAKYDSETNTVGGILGWFKDEDVYACFDNYAEVNNDGLYDPETIESSRAKIDNDTLQKILNPNPSTDDVNALMEEYLEEALKYYRENPEVIEKDIEKEEIVIDNRGKTYRKQRSSSIEDVTNEFLDIAYIAPKSIGNTASDGSGKTIRKGPLGYKPVVVVKIDNDEKYPIAVAEYDSETNTIGKVIGWFKDKDIYSEYYNYSKVIEMPISRFLTYGNIFSFDLDENFNMVNHQYWLPGMDYVGIEDNCRHGVMIDYTEVEKEGYYSNYITGLYVSEEREPVRAKLDKENTEKVLKLDIPNK